MQRSQRNTLIILIIMSIILLLNSFITKSLNKYSICVFILLFTIISYLFLGHKKEKSRYNKDIILSIIIYITIYYISTYILGLLIGFNRNIYSLSITNIIKNIIPLIITITLSEILRYNINNKIKQNNLLLVVSLITFFILDTTLTISSLNYKDKYTILKVLGLYILPSLSKNLLLTYLTTKVSYKPTITYRYLAEIPRYILPIIPAFGTYIESIINITLPVIIFILIYNNFKKREKHPVIVGKRNYKCLYYIVVPILIITIILTSGLFNHESIVIATGSMTPNINKGDIVIVKKLPKEQITKLKKGDILVYERDNKVIVHRIYKTYNSPNEVLFQTKGDNNNAPDNYLIEEQEIIGTTILRLRYIGYPTIKIYELLNQ